MKIDPSNHKEKYKTWKEKVNQTNSIANLSKENSDLILRYIGDMEVGLNVAVKNKKGARSCITLNNIRQRISFLANLIEKRLGVCLSNLTEEALFGLFNDMRTGVVKRVDGTDYQSVGDYIRVFKAFWHWYQRVSKKQGIEIRDITSDLDTKQDKPKWVYLTEEEVKKLCDNAKYDYRVLFMLLFDSGIRSPTELMNVKVSDLYNDCKELNIREEASKTFGRRIKLMLSSSLLKEYIKINNLKPEDQLFDICPTVVNRYIKRLASKLFGDKESPAGAKYSKMTMYDFRHISCCYWLPRYKSESALKYRFGWKKSDKIHYYSELLGMKDTISEEDLLLDLTKTEIEKRLLVAEKDNNLLKDQLADLQKQFVRVSRIIEVYESKIN